MVGKHICRTCAKEDNFTELICLFGQEANQLDLRGKIRKYTHIEVDENDTLPKSICCSCKKTIVIWHEFLEHCIKIDKELKAINAVCAKETFLEENIPVLPRPNQVNEIIDPNSSVGLKLNCAIEPLNTKRSKGCYCFAKSCNNNNTTRRMFRLPRDKRCHIWLARADRDDMKDWSMEKLKNKYLCGDHFTDDMFTNSNKNSLNWNALPTIFSDSYPKRIPSPTKGRPNETYGGRYRPIAIKPSELVKPSTKLSKNSATSQATTSTTNDTVVGSLESSGLKKSVNMFQHVLFMNADEKKIYSELKSKTISRPPRESSVGVLRKKLFIETIPAHGEIIKTIDKEAAYSNIINSPEIMKCQKTTESDEVNTATVNNNKQIVLSEEFVNNISNDSQGNLNKEVQLDSSNTVRSVKNEPMVDITGANEFQPYFRTSPSPSETLELIIPNSDEHVTSRPKNLDMFSSGVVDSIDNFRVEDADSLYSSQFFPENMNSCLSCGEVFLMKSSLAQHCKIYHGEKFDDSANIPSSSHNSQT